MMQLPVSVDLILLFPLIVVSFSPSAVFFISLCVASVALALVFMPGLYSTAYRATFPAFYAVASSLFLLPVCFCLCFSIFIATRSFGYFLVRSLLSDLPAYLRFPV